jgi:hypothetical protein
MQKLSTILIVGAPVAAVILGAAWSQSAAQATSRGQISLMETLSHWKYPGSIMLGGASMSDGGNPLLQSVKCQAILTTPDPIERVIEYYSKNLEKSRPPSPPDDRPAAKDDDAKSVSTQDDSRDRPVTIHVIVVNKADTSTTLVISRAAGEDATHIAWSHYIRLEGKR